MKLIFSLVGIFLFLMGFGMLRISIDWCQTAIGVCSIGVGVLLFIFIYVIGKKNLKQG